MKVYYRSSRATSIFHDGELVKGRPVAKCAKNTWRERADWQIAPGNMTTNCQHCLRIRRLECPSPT